MKTDDGNPIADEFETITYTRRKPNMNNKNQKNIVEVVHELHGAECMGKKCNKEQTFIGSTETRTFEIIPALVRILKHIEKTYKCDACDKNTKANIVTAKRVTSFPKAIAEDSFVAHVLIKKYLEYVPLHRQENVYSNLGIEISRQNLSNWVLKASKVLTPIFELLYADILKNDIVHMDETTLNVISNNSKTSYMWGITSSKFDNPILLYFYRDNLRHENASELLRDFKGYVHSDGYKAYQHIYGTVNVACFAHARRKYVELIKSITDSKSSKFYTLAVEWRSFTGQLYQIEHKASKLNLTPKMRYELRRRSSSDL